MSLTKRIDGWDDNARKLLLRRILEGSPDSTVNYAPDLGGPLTIQIGNILRSHAALWAQAMREQNGHFEPELGRSAWLLEMREADAQIKRFVAGHKLTSGAAA